MSELKKNFVQGKMNKDYDVRLIPEGEYIDAFNVLISNSEGSEVGSIQNSYGLDQLSTLTLPADAETIGSVSDEGRELIYWFVATNSGSSYIFEYDQRNNGLVSTVLEDTRTGANNVLKFNKQNKITGVNVIYNSFNKRTLLVWTDDINPIRCINIRRAKSYGPASDANPTFSTQDISLYKRQPHFPPYCVPTMFDTGLENNMKERFLSFAYRWKYLDGEYSALSTFSNPQFYPGQYMLDYLSHENLGMVNKFNAVKIDFLTGDKNVTDVQLVFKESNSNNIWVVDTFNKKKLYWGNDENRSFTFANNKIYSVLPEDEVNRLFDNVPLLAKAQDFIGNRIIYGNYVEGHDMVDANGDPITIEYSLSAIHEDKVNNRLTTQIMTNTEIIDGVSTSVQNSIRIDFTGKDINAGDLLNINFTAKSPVVPYHGTYLCSMSMYIGNDYPNAAALQASPEFLNFIDVIAYNNFKYFNTGSAVPLNEMTDYANKIKPFLVMASTSPDIIEIKLPYIEYQIDNTPTIGTDTDYSYKEEYFSFLDSSVNISLSNGNAYSSCKSNRSYEAGIVYLDDDGRYSTVITNAHSNSTNNCFIPVQYSIAKNTLQMDIRHKAPDWATKYKIFVKDNKLEYQTIYGLLEYKKDNYIWMKLEGQDKQKVQDGDILIVKRNLFGPLNTLIKVQALEYKTQPEGFMGNGVGVAGNYIKLKSFGGIDIAALTNNYFESTKSNSNSACNAHTWIHYTGPFGSLNPSTGLWEDLFITAGSVIRIELSNGTNNSGEHQFQKTFTASTDYSNIKDWWESEMLDYTGFDIVWKRGYYAPISIGLGQTGYVFQEDNTKPWAVGYWNIWGSTGGEIFSGHANYSDSKISVTLATSVIILETDPKDKSSEVYYETADTYLIDSNGNHLSKKNDANDPIDADVDQNGATAAKLNLSFFNCYTQGNGAESYRVKDLFNSNYLSTNTRPNAVELDGYKERRNIASLTYSGAFDKTTSYNSLNEFNLSRANYKDLDDKYGSIQKIFSRDTDLIVFQEDKLHRILYNKNLLSDAVGGGQITSVEDVLGQEIPFTGEWGIGTNPETFSNYATNIYFTDQPKGVVLRLGGDGLEPISRYGMKDWFRDNLRNYGSKFIVGGFDPSYDNYILGFTDEQKQLQYLEVDCNQPVNSARLAPGESIFYNINIGNKVGDYQFVYDIPVGELDITMNISGDDFENLGVSGDGTISISRKDTTEEATVNIHNSSLDEDAVISFVNDCPENPTLEVIVLVVNDACDLKRRMHDNYYWNDSAYGYSGASYETDYFGSGTIARFTSYTGEEGDGAIPFEGSTIKVSSIRPSTTDDMSIIPGEFTSCNKIGYVITSADYDAQQILDNAIYPAITTVGNENYIQFTFQRLGDLNKKLYIVWDYIDNICTRDNGERTLNVRSGMTVDQYILSDMVATDEYTVEIIQAPEYGSVSIGDSYITYTHFGASVLPDQYIYRVSIGGCYVDVVVNVFVYQETDEPLCYSWIIYADGVNVSAEYIDCNGDTQTVSANGSDAGGYTQTPFCGRQILSGEGNVSYQGLCID